MAFERELVDSLPSPITYADSLPLPQLRPLSFLPPHLPPPPSFPLFLSLLLPFLPPPPQLDVYMLNLKKSSAAVSL